MECLPYAISQADLLERCKVECERIPSCKSIDIDEYYCCLNSITYFEAVDAGFATNFDGFIYYDYDKSE